MCIRDSTHTHALCAAWRSAAGAAAMRQLCGSSVLYACGCVYAALTRCGGLCGMWLPVRTASCMRSTHERASAPTGGRAASMWSSYEALGSVSLRPW
eukprot:4736910-Prymnesium_polylepis.1